MSLALLTTFVAVCAIAPHDPGLSSVTLTRNQHVVSVRASFANADFSGATQLDLDHDGRMSASELLAAQESLALWVATRFELRGTTGALAMADSALALGDNDDVELTMQFVAPALPTEIAPPNELTLWVPFLRELSHGHRSYASVRDAHDVILADALLHKDSASIVVPDLLAVTARPLLSLAVDFFALGVEHILIGFDHLAFLLALLAAGITWRRALLTITAFTAAHSLTLAVAALGVVSLPSLLVESAIAGSIVFVAAANLWQRHGQAPHRWQIAFVFGLMHGFGFASVLAELFAPGQTVTVPLLAFNLGVECGQLLFAAAVVPLLLLARRTLGERKPTVVLSVAVGLAGVYWLVERLA